MRLGCMMGEHDIGLGRWYEGTHIRVSCSSCGKILEKDPQTGRWVPIEEEKS